MENNEKPEDLNGKLIDLELAKSDNNNSKVRKYLPAVVFLASTSLVAMTLRSELILRLDTLPAAAGAGVDFFSGAGDWSD